MRKFKKSGGNYYESGGHNVIDDICGFKVKASETVRRWDGMIMRREDYEERHPQDFLRGSKERIGVRGKDIRNPTDVFFTSRDPSEL